MTVDGWIIGLEHSLSKRSRLWIEYGDNNLDDSVTGIDPDTGDFLEAADVANLSIGMRHDF